MTGDTAYPFGLLTRALLLTGQRRNEVAHMRWPEIDVDGAMWHLPAVSTKTGRAHDVPLSSAMLDLLASTPRYGGDFVFSTRGGAVPVSGFSKAKARLDGLLPDMPPWRFHDLRRTFATHLEELGTARSVIAALLNHAGGSVTDVYTRAGLATDKRNAVEQVADLFSGAPTPEDTSKVVYLQR